MRAEFTNDRQMEILYHLKRGPVIVPWLDFKRYFLDVKIDRLGPYQIWTQRVRARQPWWPRLEKVKLYLA